MLRYADVGLRICAIRFPVTADALDGFRRQMRQG
jgi:hypothetical protein